LPAGQLVHELDPEAEENEPAEQVAHAVEPDTEEVPAAQLAQVSEETADK